MTHALVAGAGIAGTVTAMALKQAGVDVDVFEAHAKGADHIGTFLTLQSNGIDALRAIDAADAVASVGFPTPTMRFYSGSGKHLGAVPLGGSLADGTTSRTMMRADLYRVLRDEALRRGVRIHYGKRLRDAATGVAGRAAVTFDDGSTAAGDVLVGADGVRSRLRAVIDPAAPKARYLAVLNVGGTARNVSTSTRPGEYGMIFGRRAFFGWTVAPDGETWWFANPPRVTEPAAAELAAMSTDDWRRWLLELYAVDAGPATELITATMGELRGWATYDMPSVPRWHRDGMVVIGDAAHAASPSSGQGAAMAIEDGVILAKCLRDLPEIDEALSRYESVRRDRVERVVAVGARSSNMKAMGPVARVLRDLMMPLFLRRVASRGSLSQDWMHRYHIDWAAPVDQERVDAGAR